MTEHLFLLSTKQISLLTITQLNIIIYGYFPDHFNLLSNDIIMQLDPIIFYKISVNKFNSLSDEQIKSLTPAQIEKLNDRIIKSLSKEKIKLLSNEQIKSLNMSDLNKDQFDLFSEDQFKSLNLKSLIFHNLIFLKPETHIKYITPDQLNDLDDFTLGYFTSKQAKAFSPDQKAKLTFIKKSILYKNTFKLANNNTFF